MSNSMAIPGDSQNKSAFCKNANNEKEPNSKTIDIASTKNPVGNSAQASSAFGCTGSFSSSISSALFTNAATNSRLVDAKSTIPPADDNMVKLNVYGLAAVNQVTKYLGLGIFHSGVQVYGAEWAYGGYPKPIPSIYRMKKPRDLASLSDIDGRFHFIETLEMGMTKFTYDEVRKILANLGKKDWYGTNYHLLYRNCNNFSNELCKILCNKTIPVWINRVASVFSKFPFLVKMLPKEYFSPIALQDKLTMEQAQKYQLAKINSELETVDKHEASQNDAQSPEATVYKGAETAGGEKSITDKLIRVSCSMESSEKSVALDEQLKSSLGGTGSSDADVKVSAVNGEQFEQLRKQKQIKSEKSEYEDCQEDAQLVEKRKQGPD